MKIGIIGLGLMGASFGRTLVKKGLATVYGADADAEVLLKAELLGAMNEPLTTKNAAELDILVCAVFPRAVKSAVEPYLPYLKEGAIVLDFCGLKRLIVDCFSQWAIQYPSLVFVGGHPMAGREYSGIDHSVTTLFEKASMVLVPVNADIFALDSLKRFFLSVGFSKVVVTDAYDHDRMIAFTSQLCHILSNNYIKNKSADRHDGFSAGSYKDLTRVARLNPVMWSQLMMDNRDVLVEELNEYIDHLVSYRNALTEGDEEALKELLAEGNNRKLKIDGRNKNATQN